MSFSRLSRLKSIPVRVSTDEGGLLGRECPNADCLGYFKVKIGTGLKGEDLPCHCPYCGHTASHNHFWTQEQIKYLESVAARKIQDALERDVHDWNRELQASSHDSLIKVSAAFEGRHHPIHHYREKQLETKVTCDNCTLEYAIYGVFAYCPDCGTHNSLPILKKNFELVEKELVLASNTEDSDFAAYLIADALENAVSSFDGFGRQVCSLYAQKATGSAKAEAVSFQNLIKARTTINKLYGYDLASSIDPMEWAFCVQCFQKRHLLAHTMGVVDQQYVDITHDPAAAVGRKIPVSLAEVRRLIELLSKIGADCMLHL